MTATIIESDTDTIEHLDFEEAVPCESGWCPPNEAEVIVETMCCKHRLLICEDCMYENIERENALRRVRTKFVCAFCKTETGTSGSIRFVRWLDRGR